MKLEANAIGVDFKVADFEILKQYSEQSLGENGGHHHNPHTYTVENIEMFLESLSKLFPDCSYSRDELLAHAATVSEEGYSEALQHTFDLIDNKNSRPESDSYNFHRFGKLFSMAYKFSLYESISSHEVDSAENKPGFFFVMRVAENVTNHGGSYGGYVGRMINYVSFQILEHQVILKSQAEINQLKAKPKATLSM